MSYDSLTLHQYLHDAGLKLTLQLTSYKQGGCPLFGSLSKQGIENASLQRVLFGVQAKVGT